MGEGEAFVGDVFALSGKIEFAGVHFDSTLFFENAEFGAGGEIGEALELDELGRGVVAGGGEIVGGLEDRLADMGGAPLVGAELG